MMSGSDALHWA